jgi:Tfp pilus assembly protein PilF
MGEILSDQGRFVEAEGYFREAYNIWRSARYHMGVAVVTSNLGRLAARVGRLDEAREGLAVALEDLRSIKAENFAIETAGRLAECHLYTGDPTSATLLIDDAITRLSGLGGSAYLRATLLRLKACALLQSGDVTSAEQVIDEAVQLARSLSAQYDIALGLHVLAEIRGGAPAATAESAAILASLGVEQMPPSPAHPLA